MTSRESIRVLIADKNPVVRAALRSVRCENVVAIRLTFRRMS